MNTNRSFDDKKSEANARAKMKAAVDEIIAADKEGRAPVMPDGVNCHVNYGSGSKACKCNCPDGDCEHQWDGENVEIEGGFSASCSRCGKTAMSHDMWLF